jgi:hypothetical protein
MTDRDDRGARRLKAAWNRLADRVRARMEHVPPLGTVLVSAEVFRRAMRENRELKARVRELEAAARAVVEAARGARFALTTRGGVPRDARSPHRRPCPPPRRGAARMSDATQYYDDIFEEGQKNALQTVVDELEDILGQSEDPDGLLELQESLDSDAPKTGLRFLVKNYLVTLKDVIDSMD